MESTKTVKPVQDSNGLFEQTDAPSVPSDPVTKATFEPTRFSGLGTRANTVKALFEYISRKRLWGMVVLLGVLLLVSIVVITAEAFTYLAPFVYAIF